MHAVDISHAQMLLAEVLLMQVPLGALASYSWLRTVDNVALQLLQARDASSTSWQVGKVLGKSFQKQSV